MSLHAKPRSGRWTPTFTGVTNVDAVTGSGIYSLGSDGIVRCWLALQVDPAAASAWELRASLPIGADLEDDYDLIGGSCELGTGFGGAVRGAAAQNEAFLAATGTGAGPQDWTARFSYLVP